MGALVEAQHQSRRQVQLACNRKASHEQALCVVNAWGDGRDVGSAGASGRVVIGSVRYVIAAIGLASSSMSCEHIRAHVECTVLCGSFWTSQCVP